MLNMMDGQQNKVVQYFKPSLMILSAACLMAGCASKATNPTGASLVRDDVPEVHLVKSGDTVSKIAMRYGLNWREISALNNLDANHTIYVGQRLKLYPKNQIQTQQNTPTSQKTVLKNQNTAVLMDSPPSTISSTTNFTHGSATLIGSSGLQQFIYPVAQSNPVVRNFGTPVPSGLTQGMFFAGKAGDVVAASASGTVVIANSGDVRPLVMIDHGRGFSSTYFDLQDIKVRAGQNIAKGDKLGVMTAQTSSGTALFEFRIAQNGRYIDPVSVLR